MSTTTILTYASLLGPLYCLYSSYNSKFNDDRWPGLAQLSGTLFTFIGITIALFGFDTADIDGSVPIMISGMRLAFISSIAGMTSAMIIRHQRPYEIEDNVVLEDSIDDISLRHDDERRHIEKHDTLKSMVSLLRQQSDKKDDDERAAMSREYLKTVSESVSDMQETNRRQLEISKAFYENSDMSASFAEAIKKAVEVLDEHLDKKLTQTLGRLSSTVGQLSESVDNVREWQENVSKTYRDIVLLGEHTTKAIEEETKRVLDDNAKSMSKLNDQVQEVSETTSQKYTDSMSKLNDQIQEATVKTFQDYKAETEILGERIVGVHAEIVERVVIETNEINSNYDKEIERGHHQ